MWPLKRMQAQHLTDPVMDLIWNIAYSNEYRVQVVAFKSKGRTQ